MKVIPAIPCRINITRQGDTFKVEIVNEDNGLLQDIHLYKILDGDMIFVKGLGFKVEAHGDESMNLNLFEDLDFPKESKLIDITLKRKMDLPHGET